MLHGHFSPDLPPALEVASGDAVRFSLPNAGWMLDRGEVLYERDERLDAGHALCGPIAVRGARAGGVLAVQIDEVRVGRWGVTSGDGHEVHWTLDPDAGTG